MVVEVYGMGYSAPTRNLFLVCEALGIDYKINPIDLFKGDNRTPEYLKAMTNYIVMYTYLDLNHFSFSDESSACDSYAQGWRFYHERESSGLVLFGGKIRHVRQALPFRFEGQSCRRSATVL